MIRGSIRVCTSLLLFCSYLPLFAQQAGDSSKGVAGKDESDGSSDTPCALEWAPTRTGPKAPGRDSGAP